MPEITSGQPVYGRDFPPSGYDQDWTLQLNIASTSYASGTPEVAVNVTAPSSGRVLVCIGAGIRNNGANTDTVIVTYRVLEDHSLGPVFTAESAYRGVTSLGAGDEEFSYQGNYALEEDLIPGRNYYFQVRHRATVGSSTCDIASRNILVIPMP
jgi:hypothetical protein